MNKINLKKEIDKIKSIIELNQSIKNKLENYNFILEKLKQKYNDIEIYFIDNDYNFYADLTNIKNKKIYFENIRNSLLYYIKAKDKEYKIDIFDIKTINYKAIIRSDTWYHDDGSYHDDDEYYGEYVIEIAEDLKKLSNQFKNSDEVLGILKSKILEFINLKPDGCRLSFESPKSNKKIIENIQENMLFL